MSVYPSPLFVLIFLVVVVAGLPGRVSAADPVPVVWRTDYNAARKEAADKGLPLCIVIGSENCFYCKKLEGGPLRNAAVLAELASNFVPLKVDATTDPALPRALKVQLYPTTVLAGPDGKIHAYIEGYVDAERLHDNLKRAVTASTTADWAARDFEQASKALAAGDYPSAVSLLKGIHREAGDKPVGLKARQILEEVERLAAGRLARAQELERLGLTQEALDAYAEAMKSYAGTRAATDAANRLTGLAARPEMLEKLRGRAARDLLAAAREDFRNGRFYDCLQKCEQLATAYPDSAETREAETVAAAITGNPERLAAACEQLNQRTVTMYLTLADAWVKKGQTTEAIGCLEKVLRLAPDSQQAQLAQAQLTRLRANGQATPAGLMKPGSPR